MAGRSTPWASGMGVTLVEVRDAQRTAFLADAGIRQALLDGVDRGLSGDPPEIPSSASVLALREGRRTTGPADGIVALARDLPRAGEAALIAVAIAPASRGRALATKALLLVERRLSQDGVTRLFVRVPRKNGRGLYYMLRCGFTPVTGAAPRDGGDATWFARGTGRAG
ncbi:MAG: GNAT family N-acetyltransferase [Dehalococcoidia bacterium]|nr:MAG: GNAT family N-acetyltransferase [Dehalococcoidia bacterium]